MDTDRTLISAIVTQPPSPADVVYLAGEAVLLLAVALPEMSQAQRRVAVVFAVEDQIARPLEEVHVILGPALPGGRDARNWLVAVIARDVLQAIPHQRNMRLLPDTLALPLPEAGQWSVWADGPRILVRTPDGAGFATVASALPSFHHAAGSPAIVLYGGALDAQFAVLRFSPLTTQLDPSLQRFDLNSGRALGRGMVLPRAWKQAAAMLLVAGLGHMGILVADTWALDRIRDASQTSVRDILEDMGQPAGADLDVAISVALSRTNGSDRPRFIPLLARAFAALEPHAGDVTASDLRYSAEQNSLSVTLQAPDIATLQGVGSVLTKAGFRVAAGAATTSDGLAEQTLTMQQDKS